MTARRPPLWVLLTITVTSITANPIVTSSIPEILAGVGAPASAAGLFVAAATLPGIVLAPIIGVLADRYGRREVLVPCLVLFGVAGGAAAFSPSLAVLIALRFLQGAGSAGLINLVVVVIGDNWSGHQRTRLIGFNSATITVALAVLPVIGGLLTDLGGWRAPFFVFPLGLVTAVATARMLPRSRRRDVTIRDQLGDATPILRRPRVVAVMVATVVVFALIFGEILTVMPLYLDQQLGITSSTLRGLVLGVVAVGATAASLTMSTATARLGRRRVLRAGALLLVAALALLAASASLPALLVALVLFGLGEGIFIPSLQDIATEAAPTASRGAVVATQVGAARFGQTLGPLGVTGVLRADGPRAAFLGGAVLAAIGLLPLADRASAPDDPTEAATG